MLFELEKVLVLHHMMTSVVMYDIEADRSTDRLVPSRDRG